MSVNQSTKIQGTSIEQHKAIQDIKQQGNISYERSEYTTANEPITYQETQQRYSYKRTLPFKSTITSEGGASGYVQQSSQERKSFVKEEESNSPIRVQQQYYTQQHGNEQQQQYTTSGKKIISTRITENPIRVQQRYVEGGYQDVYSSNSRTEIEKLMGTIKNLEYQLKVQKDLNQEYLLKIEELSHSKRNINQEGIIIESYEQRIKQLHQEIDSILSSKKRLELEISRLQIMNSNLKEEITVANSKSIVKEIIVEKYKDNPEMLIQIEQCNKEIIELKKISENQREYIGSLDQQIIQIESELNVKCNERDTQISYYKEELTKIQNEQIQNQQQLDQYIRECKLKDEQIKQYITNYIEKSVYQGALMQLQANISQLQQDYNGVLNQKNILQQQYDSLQENYNIKVTEFQQQYETMENQLRQLRVFEQIGISKQQDEQNIYIQQIERFKVELDNNNTTILQNQQIIGRLEQQNIQKDQLIYTLEQNKNQLQNQIKEKEIIYQSKIRLLENEKQQLIQQGIIYNQSIDELKKNIKQYEVIKEQQEYNVNYQSNDNHEQLVIIAKLQKENDEYRDIHSRTQKEIAMWKERYATLERGFDTRLSVIENEYKYKTSNEIQKEQHQITLRFESDIQTAEKLTNSLKNRLSELEQTTVILAAENNRLQQMIKLSNEKMVEEQDKFVELENIHNEQIVELKNKIDFGIKSFYEKEIGILGVKYNQESKGNQVIMKQQQGNINELESQVYVYKIEIDRLNALNLERINEINLWKSKIQLLENTQSRLREEEKIAIEKSSQQLYENRIKEMQVSFNDQKNELSEQVKQQSLEISRYNNINSNLSREYNELVKINENMKFEIQRWNEKYKDLDIRTKHEITELNIKLLGTSRTFVEKEVRDMTLRFGSERQQLEMFCEKLKQKVLEYERKIEKQELIIQELTSKSEQIQNEFNKLSNNYKKLQTQSKVQLEEMRIQYESYKATMTNDSEWAMKLKAERASYETQIIQLKQRMYEYEHINMELKAQIQKYNQESSEKIKEIETQFKTRQQYEKNTQYNQTMISTTNNTQFINDYRVIDIQKQKNTLEVKLNILHEKCSKYEETIKLYQEQIEGAQNKIDEYIQRINKLILENEGINEEREKLQNEVISLSDKNTLLAREIHQLIKERDSFKVLTERNQEEIARKNIEIEHAIKKLESTASKQGYSYTKTVTSKKVTSE